MAEQSDQETRLLGLTRWRLAEFVSLITYLFAEVLDGRNAHLADGVQRALGRPPRDFADYARATAATGVWSGRLAG